MENTEIKAVNPQIENVPSLNPQLVIGGKAVKPAPPKMRVWREFLAFYEKDKGKLTIDEFLDEHIRLIVIAFGKPEITKEAVEDALEISEVVPFTRELFKWLQSQVFSKLAQLPNAAAGAE